MSYGKWLLLTFFVGFVVWLVLRGTEDSFIRGAVHWGHTPLEVCGNDYSDSFLPLERRVVLENSVFEMNTLTGTKIFEILDTRQYEFCDVIINFGLPVEEDWADKESNHFFRFNEGKRQCMVEVTDGLDIELNVSHQLGHCLNLADDSNSDSLMRDPYYSGPRSLSEEDISSLREVYGIVEESDE